VSYAADHAGALADLRADGAAVTFTLSSGGAHDPATGLFTAPATASTVTGVAVQVAADPKTYARLGLLESEAVSLLTATDTFGESIALGSRFTWGGQTYTVREVGYGAAPAGTAIVSTVVGAR
jgi:hypothetical protein